MGLTADAAHGIERVQICFARNTVADVVRGFQEFLQVIKSVGSVEKSDSLLSMVSSRDRILIFIQSSPQPLTQPECDVLTGHVSRGGSLLMLLHERMDDQVLSSGNFVLEGFGISANADSVLRTTYADGFYHPKEALIQSDTASRLIYPYGCTLNTRAPAVPILSTGACCYPFHRPVGVAQGSVAVFGSFRMFADAFINRGENRALAESVLKFLIDPVKNKLSASTQISDYKYMSDASSMAKDAIGCWTSFLDPLPEDLSELADLTLFDGNIGLLEEVKAAHAELGIEFEPIESIVRPAFVVPKLKPVPAVYPPSFFPIIQPPEIPLVDLDDLLAPPEVILNRLANKCSEDDLDEFINKAGASLEVKAESAADVLKEIVQTILGT